MATSATNSGRKSQTKLRKSSAILKFMPLQSLLVPVYVVPPSEAALLSKAKEAQIKSTKSELGSGSKKPSANTAQSLRPCDKAEGASQAVAASTCIAQAEATERAEQSSSEETELHGPAEGFKETDVATNDQSAVYDSACEDHLFSDGAS